jgi:hypothetical protein
VREGILDLLRPQGLARITRQGSGSRGRRSAVGPGGLSASDQLVHDQNGWNGDVQDQSDLSLDRLPNAKRFVELANAVDPGQRGR